MSNSLKALMKKKTLFAFVLALTIFGAVYGFAATLNLSTNQLSAGNATVASCQSHHPCRRATRLRTTRRSAGYKVGTVTVTSLDAACATKSVSVTLTGAAGANLQHDHRCGSGRRRHHGADPRRDGLGGCVTGLSVAVNG